jgi:hypothetical protein
MKHPIRLQTKELEAFNVRREVDLANATVFLWPRLAQREYPGGLGPGLPLG